MAMNPDKALSYNTGWDLTLASDSRPGYSQQLLLSALECPVPSLLTVLKLLCFSFSPTSTTYLLLLWVGQGAGGPLGHILCLKVGL